MPSVRLTDRHARNAGPGEYRDALVPGFGLRVRDSGRRSWFVLVGKSRRTIGHYPPMELAVARERAREVLTAIELGQDPWSEEAAGETVSEVASAYLELYSRRRHSESWRQFVRRVVDDDLVPAVGDRPVADLSRADVALWLDRLAERGPVAANRARSILSGILSWAVSRGILDANVVGSVPPVAREAPRERVLEWGEIRAAWRGCEASPTTVSRWLRAVLLTCQRPSVVMALEWARVTEDGWYTVPKAKSGRSHRFYLSSQARAVLPRRDRRRRWVFPARGGGHLRSPWPSVRRIVEATDLPRWTAKDLQRTAATRMVDDLGVSVEVVREVMGHAPRGITRQVYARAGYSRQIRAALIAWGERVEREVGGERAVVVPMR